MGSLFRWLATAQDTGGAFALAEIEVRAGSEPPPHQHTHEEESFYVLEGSVDFYLDGCLRSARAGDFVVLPRGRTHAFRVRSDRARALMCITPAGLEDAFFATSEAAPRCELPPPPEGPPPRELIERVLAVHGARGVSFETGGAR
jgi:quercetin dioxygenase-like cupin family protein